MDFDKALRFFESANNVLCVLISKGPLTPAEEMLFHSHQSLVSIISMVIEGYLQQHVVYQQPEDPNAEAGDEDSV